MQTTWTQKQNGNLVAQIEELNSFADVWATGWSIRHRVTGGTTIDGDAESLTDAVLSAERAIERLIRISNGG